MKDKYLEARKYYINFLHELHEIKEQKNGKYENTIKRLITNTQRMIHVLDVIKIATDGAILPWLSDEKKEKISNDIRMTFGYNRLLNDWTRDHEILNNYLSKKPVSIRNGILQYEMEE